MEKIFKNKSLKVHLLAGLLILVIGIPLIQIAAFRISGYYIFNGAKSPDISVDNNKIKFSLKQGEVKQYPLRFTNAGAISSYITLAIEAVKNLIALNKQNFEIQPKNIQEVSLIVFAPSKQIPDVYEGKLLVEEVKKNDKAKDGAITGMAPYKNETSHNILKVIDSLVDISTKNTLFKISLLPEKLNGTALTVRVEITNNGAPSPADVFFEIYSKKIGGDIIDSRIKKINLKDTIAFAEELNVPGEKSIIYAKLRHNGEVLVSSVFYDASIKAPEKPFLYEMAQKYASPYFIIPLSMALLIISLWILKNKYNAEKAKAGKNVYKKAPYGSKEIGKLKKRLVDLEEVAKKKKQGKNYSAFVSKPK